MYIFCVPASSHITLQKKSVISLPVDIEENPAELYRTYLGDQPPRELPKYLEEFATEGVTNIVDGPEMMTCAGVSGHSHQFLAADGHSTCEQCGTCLCQYCNESIGEKKYCLVCYAEMKLVPPDNNEPSTSDKRIILSSSYNMNGVN